MEVIRFIRYFSRWSDFRTRAPIWATSIEMVSNNYQATEHRAINGRIDRCAILETVNSICELSCLENEREGSIGTSSKRMLVWRKAFRTLIPIQSNKYNIITRAQIQITDYVTLSRSQSLKLKSQLTFAARAMESNKVSVDLFF